MSFSFSHSTAAKVQKKTESTKLSAEYLLGSAALGRYLKRNVEGYASPLLVLKGAMVRPSCGWLGSLMGPKARS